MCVPKGLISVGPMDTASMIMGASIASVAWVGFYPWAKLRRLRELEAAVKADGGPEASQ